MIFRATKTRFALSLTTLRPAVLPLAAAVFLAASETSPAQTWTPLANTPQANGNPVSIQMLLLLPDGTVMAQQAPSGTINSTAWFRLRPDEQGSYASGSWSSRGSMAEARLFYSSVVLNTGKVFVAGGEYSSNGTQSKNGGVNNEYSATAELYDPVTDLWTPVPAVPQAWIFQSTNGPLPFSFGDSQCTLLANGNVLLGPVFGNGGYRSTIYDVGNKAWIDGPAQFTSGNDSGNPNEATWLKLRDGSILTISQNSQASQRFLPATATTPNQWVADANLPVPVWGFGTEIGAAFLQPDGKGFFIGANGKTAIYTPSNNANPGSWAAGPLIPNVVQNVLDNNGNTTGTTIVTGAAPDTAGCSLVDGKVLCAFTGQLYNDPRGGTNISTYWQTHPNPQYPAPVSFYIYDPVTQTFGPQINGPTGQTDNIQGFQATMLALPDGKVLYSDYNARLYVFDPGTPPIAAGKPVITSVASNLNGGYHLTGKGLNGISTGAAFGDDAQMDTNFPLVRITDNATSKVYYAPTSFWSSTGVQTGAQIVSTEFVLPPGLPNTSNSTYSLVVVANGFASDPIPFLREIWVDFNAPNNNMADGSFDYPYTTFALGRNAVGSGGVLWIKAGHGNETVTNLNKPMTIQAYGGPVTIGP